MAPQTSITKFRVHLARSDRVLAVLGAGLSAASGLPTFRGAGGLWRNHDSMSLATPEAFEEDPALVWLFYAWRKHMALKAKPNRGHFALTELAKNKANFLCLSQNVDGLSPRAGHPASQLRHLHGSILDVKCFNDCGYVDRHNLSDPPFAALASACEDYPADQTMPLLDPKVPPPNIPLEEIPRCPKCQTGLLRPGVVWFGESLDSAMLSEVDEWIWKDKVDIVLVIGTSSAIYPAAGYANQARKMGAVVAVINPDPESGKDLKKTDFFFEGSADEILPELFEEMIGKMDAEGKIIDE
ncbi:DHS-like NAD/FAD-binding domain-containing protein [Astrocystis sublimbata]|nr:DHS-like NAD/FAD-binding domain-containing protein [Astrocystis sublimbata]